MNTAAELLAPAGDFETALAAFAAGADAVYCGLSDFSARAFAANFSLEQLKDLIRYAHNPGLLPSGQQAYNSKNFSPSRLPACAKRVYVTFNTLLDEANLEEAVERLSRLEETGVDAIIVQDLGVARIARNFFPDLTLHASTQLVAHNLEGVLALKELGFKRVVLARELSLAEIRQIRERCGDMELEVFIHGALCYSISGLCLYGAMEMGRSGNRGKCPYCCRQSMENPSNRRFIESSNQSANRRIDESTNAIYPFSMKDLRLGEEVKKLAEIGVASLKIEGRMKSPLYVASVVKWYRQILGEREAGWGEREEVRGEREEVRGKNVTEGDLETVFSRRTTKLRFNAPASCAPAVQRRGACDEASCASTVLRRGACAVASPIDAVTLGHRGTPIGEVKRITRDREGRAWLRFHTYRALEKHDGLQFDALTDEGRHFGFGITEMRLAISRAPVFEVSAGADVEILLPEEKPNRRFDESMNRRFDESPNFPIRQGDTIYCSMSNAVKRMFPAPSFRPGDYPGLVEIDVEVAITADRLTAAAVLGASASARNGAASPLTARAEVEGVFDTAKTPEKTFASVEKAFSKLGGTDYRLGKLTLVDEERRFAPASVLNDLRRELVEKLDAAREAARQRKVDAALDSLADPALILNDSDRLQATLSDLKVVKLRAEQTPPPGDWDEIVVAIDALTPVERLKTFPIAVRGASTTGQQAYNSKNFQSSVNNLQSSTFNVQPSTFNVQPSTFNVQPSTFNVQPSLRLALPVWNGELEFNKLRSKVKSLIREGFTKWECSDLATLRLLKSCGVDDITADWSLYAFNSAALAALAELGVVRFVASPENSRENLAYLAESGYAVEFLKQQSTPLFISLHEPILGASASAQDRRAANGLAANDRAASGRAANDRAFRASPLAAKNLAVFRRGGLWITTKNTPRVFETPSGASTRIDLSWDAGEIEG